MRIFYPRLNRENLIKRIHEKLPRLLEHLPLKRVVLFGSYAKNNYTVASDVDLLVVYQDPPREDAYRLIKRMLDVRGLEPHAYAASEYARMKGTLEKMTGEGIVLLPRNPA